MRIKTSIITAVTALTATWAAGVALSKGTGSRRYPTTAAIDTSMWDVVRVHTRPALDAWTRAAQLGDRYVVVVIAILAAMVLGTILPARSKMSALAVPASLLLAGATAQLLAKPLIGRHIADGVDAYPSGHATGTAAVATAIYLVLSTSRARNLAAVVAVSWSLAVGLGMAATGSHYPTDVLAGWVWGAAWAVLVTAWARTHWSSWTTHRPQDHPERATRDPAAVPFSAGASPAGSRCSSSPRSPGDSC